MKPRIILSFLFLSIFFLFAFALPDEMIISVEAERDIFVKKSFTNGEVIFTNRTYTLENIPVEFTDYEFLASGGKVIDLGTIIPSSDGLIYMIAPSGGLSGWTIVENSEFNYNDNAKTKVSIYQKQVAANQRVSIPLVESFPGTTPIAKVIDLQIVNTESDARLATIKVNGMDIEFFNKEKLSYPFYLPYTFNSLPVIAATINESIATATITQATNIIGTEAERTATIEVKSQDLTTTMMYKIIFEKLPELDLFLSIGQSNMSGRAPMDVTKGDFDPIPNTYLFTTSTQFMDAVNPLNLYSNIRNAASIQKIGPSFSFSKEVSSKTDRKIGLVVNAKGGSSIESWDKNGIDTLYSHTLVRALEAKKWGTYKAILWHQGESNRYGTAIYPQQVSKLVADLRIDLGDANLFFVAGEIGYWRTDFAAFNSMIRNISTFVNNSAYASAEGLTNVDDSHFDRESQLILGERYADIVLNNVYGITSVALPNQDNMPVVSILNKKLYISVQNKTLTSICEVSDISGRQIYRKEFFGNIQLPLQPGVYIVQVENNYQSMPKKVIVR
ncbi:MAG: T9SS type A sorting domain-containing protein [Paludibacter sp.]|nr:T9SS type A sorting domain-containing protein [Paludibacter sp.]